MNLYAFAEECMRNFWAFHLRKALAFAINSPKSEALAERSRRTAVLPSTAVERRTHPYTTKPSLGVPLLACAVGGGTCPDPMAGHPLHLTFREDVLGRLE